MTTTQWVILLVSVHAANLLGLFLLYAKHNRWRAAQDRDLDDRINEIIDNRNRRQLAQSGRDYPARLDAGKPARISTAKFRRN